MLEIENIEVRVNLQFMEKLNKMLMGEISKFKAILKENNVFSENDHNYNYPERRMSRERLESIEEETVDSKYVFLFIISATLKRKQTKPLQTHKMKIKTILIKQSKMKNIPQMSRNQ